MKISFVSHLDPNNPRLWSGIPYHMSRSFKRIGCEVETVGPINDGLQSLWLGKKVFYHYAMRRRYLIDRERRHLMTIAAAAEEHLKASDHDCVISPGSTTIAYMDSAKPMAIWTDATFHSMLGFYASFTNLARESVKAGHRAEREALKRCTVAAYTSNWAARSAIEYYGADPDKVIVVPFGANLEDAPSDDVVDTWIEQRPDDRIDLLFLAVEWERKGGPLAFDTITELNRRGIPARLAVVGCNPPDHVASSPHVTVTGPLRKWMPDEGRRLRELMALSHFLFLPSKADCTPIVFCEASAFGLPSVSRDIGGIASVVMPGQNGLLLDAAAEAPDYATAIAVSLNHRAGYTRLCRTSRSRYVRELTWETGATRITTEMKKRA